MGLRGRLLTLMGLALLPAFGLMLVSTRIERSAVRNEAERYALTLSQTEALNQLKTIEEARTALILLAGLRQLPSSPHHCDRYLRHFVDQEPRLANIGITNPNGRLLCSALPVHRRTVGAAETPLARLVSADWQFTLNDRAARSSRGRPSLIETYPVMGASGSVSHILFAVMPTA